MKGILACLITMTLLSCAASPDNERAATVSGNMAPPAKPASVQAAQMLAPVTR